jgi:hypothetical protein
MVVLKQPFLLTLLLVVRGSSLLVLPSTRSSSRRLETSTVRLFDTLDVRYTPKDDGSGLDYAERSRPFRRDVFAYDDWVRHRSSDRFAGRLMKLFRSGIVRGTSELHSTPKSILITADLDSILLYSIGEGDRVDDIRSNTSLRW